MSPPWGAAVGHGLQNSIPKEAKEDDDCQQEHGAARYKPARYIELGIYPVYPSPCVFNCHVADVFSVLNPLPSVSSIMSSDWQPRFDCRAGLSALNGP